MVGWGLGVGWPCCSHGCSQFGPGIAWRRRRFRQVFAGITASASAVMNPSIQQELLALPPDKQTIFWAQFNSRQKSPGVALGLCFFLGGIGAHHFYLGNPGMGLVFALFCWTFIPTIIAFIQCFSIMGHVGRMNDEVARRIIGNLKADQHVGTLQPSGASVSSLDSAKAEIAKLDEMLAVGTITHDEYQALRKKALGL